MKNNSGYTVIDLIRAATQSNQCVSLLAQAFNHFLNNEQGVLHFFAVQTEKQHTVCPINR